MHIILIHFLIICTLLTGGAIPDCLLLEMVQKNKQRSKSKRVLKKTVLSGESVTGQPSGAKPGWIFKTNKIALLYDCLLFTAFSFCFIFGMSLYTLILGLTLTTVKWALSPPDRKIKKEFYDTPRRFLLTGSASGMSQHLTKTLLSRGHYVCATDIMYTQLLQQYPGENRPTNLLLQKLDVTNSDNWDEVVGSCVEVWGGLDVVFNIAGVLCPHKIQDATLKEINLQLDVNIKGVVLGTRAAARCFLSHPPASPSSPRGHIVNFSSMGGLATVSGVTLYAASKFAVRGFSSASSKDLANANIAVSCFMPDAVQTPMVDLQLNFDEASMAFSGEILSLEEVEDCIMNTVLIERPVEQWLSSRANVARFGDIFGASRAVALAEWSMRSTGVQRQNALMEEKHSTNQRSFGASHLPDLRTVKRNVCVKYILRAFYFLCFLEIYSRFLVNVRLETAEDIALKNVKNIVGKRFVVTGGSAGIGLETARVLTKYGGMVTIASRSQYRGELAASSINGQADSVSGGQATFEQLDLSSFDSVNKFVDRQLHAQQKTDVWILNAGRISPNFERTSDGVESTLQVNFLSHQLLMDRILRKEGKNNNTEKGPTVVSLSSWGPARYSKLGNLVNGGLHHVLKRDEYPFILPGVYGISKQATVRFAREIFKRFGARSFSVHPGLVSTKLGTTRGNKLEEYGAALWWYMASKFTKVKSVQEGAATTVLCATDRAIDGRGLFYSDNALAEYPKDEDNDISKIHDRANRDANAYDEGLRIINDALAGKYRKTGTGADNTISTVGVWFNVDSSGTATTTLVSVVLHVIVHRILFLIAEYLVQSKLGENQKISSKNIRPVMISLEQRRSTYSAIIDGMYCSFLLKYGLIGSGSYLLGGFIVLFWTDFHFYVTHRLMHMSTFLYKNVHYIHHQSHNPNVWSSLSFHPVEAFIFFSAYLIVLIVPMPTVVWWAFKFGMVIGPLHAHIGYDLGAIVKGPAHHYLHHAFKDGNYGGFPTGIWDKLFNTELDSNGHKKVSSPESKYSPSSFRKCLFFFLLSQFVFDYNIPLWTIGAGSVLVWIALLDGMLVIFPGAFERKWDQKKVFVVGLSRTGTTSITEALNMLGIRTHHFCGPLVKLASGYGGRHKIVEAYVDNLDGHTDISPTIVAEELAEKYPEARFIYTTRPRDEWAHALVRFVSEEPRKTLFKNHPTPFNFYNAAYGEGWSSYDAVEWQHIHDAHEKRMQNLRKQVGTKRFLKIDITALGKKGKDTTLWNILGDFLDVDVSNAPKKFPHRYVFQYSAIDQPKRQINYLLQRIVSKTWVLLFLFALVYGGRFFDSGQCTRACRVWNGESKMKHGKPIPILAGTSGNWFEPPDVFGVRIGWQTCQCFSSERILKGRRIPRLHSPIETKDQWWFRPETTAVCSDEGKEYDHAKDVPTGDTTVSNCGRCGKCNVHDADAMHIHKSTLTKRASVGAILYLFFGQAAHRIFFRSGIVGFSQTCAECWLEATRCNLASCAQYCLFGWENPLSVQSTTDGTKLNACMHCDEIYCSAYYLQSCGTNRRAAGVVTDILRPEKDVCEAALRGYDARARRQGGGKSSP